MQLKVCGMKNWDNMKALEKLQPDLMGLIFHKASPRYVGNVSFTSKIKELKLQKVGVFVNEDVSAILEYVQNFGLSGVQLHGDETLEVCRQLKAHQLEVIKVFAIGEVLPLDEMRPYVGTVDYFLFDTLTEKRGGSGQKFDWQLLQAYSLHTPFFLSGGISADDSSALRAFEHPNWAGVDINSKFEDAPGLKNIERIKMFKDKIYAK